MSRNQRSTKDRIGLSRRVAGIMLMLATIVTGGAGLAHSEAPVTIYGATLQEPHQKTAEVSTAELRQILADQSAIVFDTRPYREYAVSHIPGARNVAAKPGVPMSEYVSDVAESGASLAPIRPRQWCSAATAHSAAKTSG